MIFIKNQDMKQPRPLTQAVTEALNNYYPVQVIINGEYYDVTPTFKIGGLNNE